MSNLNSDSDVVIKLTNDNNECVIDVCQEKIPSNEDIRSIENGWDKNIFQGIRNYIGIPIFEKKNILSASENDD